MKKLRSLLALFLCAALVLMTACGGSAAPSAPDEPSPESAPSQGETSQPPEEAMALPETLPEDTTELAVPFQVVAPWTEDVFPSGESNYSTQTEVDACRRWLYDLKAEDITGMYGVTMPLDRYWTGEMTLEDSRRIVDLLRSAAPYLAPLESGNPPTGGGWDVAVHMGDEVVGMGFNGEWFTFLREGKGWILDGTAAQESLGGISALLWEYGYHGRSPSDNTPENPVTDDVPTETFFSDEVQAIYAIDRDNYVMAEVKDGYASSKIIWEALQERVTTGGEPSGYGFLIITTEGREYVYMNFTDEDVALNKYCQAALIAGPLHPSWLIHMTPERMVSVDIMGFDGPITDRDRLLELAKFLKEEVTVQPEATIYDGVSNPDMVGGLFWWELTFDSGVEYTIMGYAGEGRFSIHTSDLDKRVSYQVDEGVDWKFIEFEGRDWP